MLVAHPDMVLLPCLAIFAYRHVEGCYARSIQALLVSSTIHPTSHALNLQQSGLDQLGSGTEGWVGAVHAHADGVTVGCSCRLGSIGHPGSIGHLGSVGHCCGSSSRASRLSRPAGGVHTAGVTPRQDADLVRHRLGHFVD